jgi:hypothetical protein
MLIAATELGRVEFLEGCFGLVEQTFLLVWLRCPVGVSIVSG